MFNNISFDTDFAHFEQDRSKGDIELQKYNLELISRLDLPITLNPETATFDDIRLHGITEQYLAPSTVEKHIRYLRFMENHPQPVNLKNLDIIDFKQHIRYRLFVEKAGVFAIHHEYKAIKMLQRAYGQPVWDIRLPPMPRHKKRNIPLPENVREFWHYKYSDNRYERKLYQYMFYHAYLEGMRNPSELANLRTDDIRFLRNKKAILTILETKKHHSIREIALPYYLSCDPYHKSYMNWLTSWRPKAENSKSDNYMFIQPNGKPFTTRFLGKKLKEQGQKVWKHFQPYCTRHWCAIAKLIETKEKTGDFRPYTVRNWLGHETIKTTEGYLRYAEQYYNLESCNWIRRVLRQPKELEDCTLNPAERVKRSKPVFPTGVTGYGPEEYYTGYQIRKNGLTPNIICLSVNQPTLSFLSIFNKVFRFLYALNKQINVRFEKKYFSMDFNKDKIKQVNLFGESIKKKISAFGTGMVKHFKSIFNRKIFFAFVKKNFEYVNWVKLKIFSSSHTSLTPEIPDVDVGDKARGINKDTANPYFLIYYPSFLSMFRDVLHNIIALMVLLFLDMQYIFSSSFTKNKPLEVYF